MDAKKTKTKTKRKKEAVLEDVVKQEQCKRIHMPSRRPFGHVAASGD